VVFGGDELALAAEVRESPGPLLVKMDAAVKAKVESFSTRSLMKNPDIEQSCGNPSVPGSPGVPEPIKVLENPDTGGRVRFFREISFARRLVTNAWH
jgi:hypothetical protein